MIGAIGVFQYPPAVRSFWCSQEIIDEDLNLSLWSTIRVLCQPDVGLLAEPVPREDNAFEPDSI